MDYPQHEATFEGFWNYTQVTTLAVLNILIVLILMTIGEAFWFGLLSLILCLLCATIGLVQGGAWKPSAFAFGVSILLFIVSLI